MKKLLFILVALAMSVVTMAGNFVMLSYSGRAELEKHFFDPNLTVHFYTDSEVFATAERFDAGSMVMIDEMRSLKMVAIPWCIALKRNSNNTMHCMPRSTMSSCAELRNPIKTMAQWPSSTRRRRCPA